MIYWKWKLYSKYNFIMFKEKIKRIIWMFELIVEGLFKWFDRKKEEKINKLIFIFLENNVLN